LGDGGSERLLKGGQAGLQLKPPSCTSKSTLTNTKAASEGASEVECTKELITS